MKILSFLLCYITLSLTTSTVLSLKIECKRQSEKCIANSAIKITEKSTVITEVIDNGDYKTLVIQNTYNFLFLPHGINSNFPDLEIMIVSNASLKEIEREDFLGLKNLATLSLTKNSLKLLPNDVFKYLENLKKIMLDQNEIQNLHSSIFENNLELTEISLSNNKIKSINDATFKNLKQLTRIFLIGNKLVDLKSGTFDGNENLEVVNVKRNQLNYIPEDIFAKNEKLIFGKSDFSDNQCIEKGVRIENAEKFVEIVKEKCKPLNFELIKRLTDENVDLKDKLNETEEKLNSKNEEIENFKDEIKEIQSEVEKKTNKVNDLKAQLEKAEKEFKNDKNELDDKISNLNQQLDDAKMEISNLKSENSEKSLKLKVQTKEHEELNKNVTDKTKEVAGLYKSFIECRTKLNDFEENEIKLNQTISNLNLSNNENKINFENKKKEFDEIKSEFEENKLKMREKEETLRWCFEEVRKANDTIDGLRKGKCDSELVAPIVRISENYDPSTHEITCAFSEYRLQFGNSLSEAYYSCNIINKMSLDCNSKLIDIKGDHFPNRSNLKVTALSINSSSYFTEFPHQIFDKFKNLKLLKISDSGFGKAEKICNEKTETLSIMRGFLGGNSLSIKNCENIQYLTADYSNLKKISLENLKILSELTLRGNEIEEIPENLFASMESLKNVQLSKNKISKIDGQIFAKNLKLEIVNFSGNPIKVIGGEFLKGNKNLAVIEFIYCECINKKIVKVNIEEGLKEIREKCREK